MADDKRAEAMRKALQEADEDAAKKRSKKPKPVDGKSISIGGKELNLPDIDLSGIKIPGVTGDGGKGTGNAKDLWETVRRTAVKVWGSRYGRLGVIGVAAMIGLIMLGNLVGGMLGTQQNVPLSFEITDSELSVYRNSSYGSGYAWDAYVEILNTGRDNIYLTDLAFRVETDTQEAICTVDEGLSVFPAVLKPGEHGYIYNAFGSELVYEANPDERLEKAYPHIADGTVSLVLRSSAVAHLAAEEPGNFVVDENSVVIEDGLNGNKAMECSIVNDSASRGSNLFAVFVTYVDDDDGDDGLKCSGITRFKLDALPPHATTKIRMDPLKFVHSMRSETVTSWKLYVY